MPIFGNETKEQKRERKEMEQLQTLIDKYNLDSIDEKDLQIIKNVYHDLLGNGFMKAGIALSMANGVDQAKVTYLSALVEQNWIIINQLSRLNKNIEKNK